MNLYNASRRRFLYSIKNISLFVAAAPLVVSCGEKSVVLACDKDLRRGETALRKSLNYVEVSPHREMHCGNCAFYSQGGGNSCGQCQIFSGPANPQGHCDSWSEIS